IGNSTSDNATADQGGTTAIHAYVTDDMQTKAWAIYFLVPGLCMLASSIPMFFYKIDKKTKTEMRAELARRRLAAEQEEISSQEPSKLSDESYMQEEQSIQEPPQDDEE
ncbi:MAG: hypothetical protein IJ226_01895, partial [Clostridia bacterium]|nr:hypothetical protein [Clostridia bacterium]